MSWLIGPWSLCDSVEKMYSRNQKQVKPQNEINKSCQIITTVIWACFITVFVLTDKKYSPDGTTSNCRFQNKTKQKNTRVINYLVVQCKCRSSKTWLYFKSTNHHSCRNMYVVLSHMKRLCYKWINSLVTAEKWLDPSPSQGISSVLWCWSLLWISALQKLWLRRRKHSEDISISSCTQHLIGANISLIWITSVYAN